jgi:hypothetical protein
MQDLLGESAGLAVTDGPGTLLNMSVGGRIGLGDVFGSSYGPWPTVHGRSYAAYLATTIGGPAYSVVEGWAIGYDEIVNKGDIMKGLQASTPKPMRDMLKAYESATEGVKLPNQRRILKAEDVGADSVFLMAMGFQPTDIFEMKRKERNIAKMSAIIGERRGMLVREYVRTMRDGGDVQPVIDEIIRFAKKNPTASQGLGSAMAQAMREFHKKDAGVRSRKEILDAMRFGG